MVRRLSIALATFNGAAHLRGQLASFASQERLADELVVSDDGSTDGTVDLVREFARAAPFDVRLSVNEVRLGCTNNFGKALSLCSGDIICLSDQDDVWFPEKLAVLCAEAEEHPALLFVNDIVNIQPDGRLDSLSFLERMRTLGVPSRSLVKGCATSVDSRLLRAALPIPDGYSHDKWLHHLGFALGSRTVVPQVLQAYRVHSEQQSGGQPKSRQRLGPRLNRRNVVRSRHKVSGELRHVDLLRDRLAHLAAYCEASGEIADEVSQAYESVVEKGRLLRLRQSYVSIPGGLVRSLEIGKELMLRRRGVYAGHVSDAIRDVLAP